jgi:hypothetical protein
MMPRYFQRLTIDQLSNRVEKAVDACGEDRYYVWKQLTPQVKKDLSKCDFDLENVGESQTDFGPNGLMGYHTLSNGLTYKGMCAGGDWEFPVFFIIYWDGKKLRGYIPKKGNPWNTDTGMPYGNSGSYKGNCEDGINLKKRYPDRFVDQTPQECDQGWELINWEPDLIRQDIMDRIVEKK